MQINEVITEELGKVDFEKIIREEVAKSVKKLVEDKVSDMFKSYGTMAKNLEKTLEEGLSVDFSRIPLNEYHEHIVASVADQLAQYFGSDKLNIEHFVSTKLLTETRKEIPYEVFKKEVFEIIKEEMLIDDEDFHEEYNNQGLVNFEIETDTSSILSSSNFKYIRIKWDDESSYKSKSYDFRIGLHNGRVFTHDGHLKDLCQWASAMKFRNTEITGVS